jgi:dihydrofolate reductase
VRRLIASEGITLDGYFSGPRGEIDWQALGKDLNGYSIELLEAADTLLFGRITYEQMKAWWPTPAGQRYSPAIARSMNTLAKLVAATQAVDVSWHNSRQISGELTEVVTDLKAQPGKDIVVLGSASLVAQLTDRGLIDEYHLTINPVVLAAGTPLFGNVRERHRLKLMETRPYAAGNVLLRYEPDLSHE